MCAVICYSLMATKTHNDKINKMARTFQQLNFWMKKNASDEIGEDEDIQFQNNIVKEIGYECLEHHICIAEFSKIPDNDLAQPSRRSFCTR
eukprot:241918_1